MQKLDERSVLGISGSDAQTFLQGLTTNDILKSPENELMYSLLLTPQGRIICDFFILKSNRMILLDLPKSQKPPLIAKLKLYRLRSDVIFEDLDETLGVFVSETNEDEFHIDPRSSKLGYRGFRNLSVAKQDNQFDYHLNRIKSSIPDFDMDIEVAKSLPIDFDMNELNALSFTKGCYVGQEVVAVTHNRGTKRKKIYSAVCTRGNFPNKGTEIFVENIKIGEMLGSKDNLGLLLLNMEEVAKLGNTIKNKLFTLSITNA